MKRLLLVAMMFGNFSTAHACVCGGGKATAADGLAQAPLIFEGRVIASRVTLAQAHGWFFHAVEYDFQVRRAWKGVSSPTVTLVSGRNDCETLFPDDGMYVVYADKHSLDDHPSSSKCGPTKTAGEAIDDFRVLGPPKTSFVTKIEISRRRSSRIRAYAVGAMAAYANLIRRPTDEASWRNVGVLALCLFVCAVGFVAAAVVAARRRQYRLSLFSLAVVPIMLIASALAAGKQTFSSAWFIEYLR